MKFKTSKGESVEGETLQVAQEAVAKWKRESANAIYTENLYAAHVTEETKLENLRAGLALADEIAEGKHNHSFWYWQRINTKLTGECVALLP